MTLTADGTDILFSLNGTAMSLTADGTDIQFSLRTVRLTHVSGCSRLCLIGFAEREAEKQRLLSRTSELNFEKEALEERAADLNAALAVRITTALYWLTPFLLWPLPVFFFGGGGGGGCGFAPRNVSLRHPVG